MCSKKKKYILILPRYNDIFGYFTAVSWVYRYIESLDIKRYNFTASLAYRYMVSIFENQIINNEFITKIRFLVNG